MKKPKLVSLEKEQLDNEDLQTIHKIEESLNKVDDIPVYTPNLQWFEQMVLTEKERVSKKQKKELALFFIISLVILSVILMTLYQMPVIFIILQIMTPVFLIIYTGIRFLKKEKYR